VGTWEEEFGEISLEVEGDETEYLKGRRKLKGGKKGASYLLWMDRTGRTCGGNFPVMERTWLKRKRRGKTGKMSESWRGVEEKRRCRIWASPNRERSGGSRGRVILLRERVHLCGRSSDWGALSRSLGRRCFAHLTTLPGMARAKETNWEEKRRRELEEKNASDQPPLPKGADGYLVNAKTQELIIAHRGARTNFPRKPRKRIKDSKHRKKARSRGLAS